MILWKKFQGILFCTDLDGTLYSSDKTVSTENLEKIEYFKSEGGLFTFITGRIPATSTHICDVVRPNAPYGCINGAAIFDPKKEEYIYKTFLHGDVIDLVKYVDAEMPQISIQFNTEKTVYFTNDNDAMKHFRQVTGLPCITARYEDITEPVFKIVFAHEDQKQIEKLGQLLAAHPKADNFDFIRSERRLYEILPKGVSKGLLLEKLAELLEIDPKKTIAVGDYNNDISMIKAAGVGFAVANAVPEAKAVADYITLSNDEHAIAAIIDGLDKGLYI